jgi:hypothetical protein
MTHARTSQDTPLIPTSASRQTARGLADLRKPIKRWRKSCSNHWEALGSTGKQRILSANLQNTC